MLPVVLAGLWAVENRARGPGAAIASPLVNALQAGVLAALILIILGRHHLGLVAESPGLDALLAGGLCALLVVRVAYQVKALGNSLQRLKGVRPPWAFFVLPLLVYVAILPWAATQRQLDGDEPYFLLITHSLIHDLDTELTNNYAGQHSLLFTSRALEHEWADPVRDDGRLYSRHSLVLPMLLAPGYLVAGKWGAMLTMAVIAALVSWLSLYLALRYWGVNHWREAVAAWALLALTPPLLLYSHQIWVELPAALLVLIALHRIQDFRLHRPGARRQWMVLGLVLMLLPLLKLRFVSMSVPLLFLAWWRSGSSRKTVLWVGLALVLAVSGILLFNLAVFDNPFKDHTMAQLLRIQGRSPVDYLHGTVGLFWDCSFGLLSSNPLWLLLAPALVLALWQRSPMLTDLLICVLPYLAVISPRREWYGAWAPPFRFGMVLLPMLVLTLVPLLRRRQQQGARGLLTALGFVALALLLVWVVVPGWTYNLAMGTHHLIDHLSVRLAADVGRFFPSQIRPRTASWLVPLLVMPLAIFFWWLPRRSPRGAGMWATAAMLLGVASLPVAAARLPTGVVEFEDRQVVKTGGRLHPDPWVPYRPRFRGGWRLAAGDSLQVPVVTGGKKASIEIDLQRVGSSSGVAEVEARAGSQLLGTWSLDAGRSWQTVAIESHAWPSDANLSLEIPGEGTTDRRVEVIFDRARLTWD